MTEPQSFLVYADGGSRGNPGPAGIGAVVYDTSTEPPTRVATVSERIGVATNNVAEYRAVIAGLEAASERGARSVHVRADSQLVVRQLEGRYRVKHANLRPLFDRARALLATYDEVVLEHVPREENVEADALVNAALDAPRVIAVLLWYVGMSVLVVFTVFRSVGVDYRLIALGAVAPLVLDLPFGRPAIAHTLAFSVALLAAVMLGTIGRPRLVRRRLLCLPIGTFCALVLSGAWLNTALLWWPTLGWSFPAGSLLGVWWVVMSEELLGLVACWWLVGMCDLYLAGPRQELVRTGRLHATADPGVGPDVGG